MINILGKNYYLDFHEMDKIVAVPSTGSTESEGMQVNLIKFEMLKMMIEVLMTEQENLDENLGVYSSKDLSLPFKLAFNTLLTHNILKDL